MALKANASDRMFRTKTWNATLIRYIFIMKSYSEYKQTTHRIQYASYHFLTAHLSEKLKIYALIYIYWLIQY